MVCRITFIEARQAAFTLAEVLVGSAIGLIVLAAVVAFMFFCSRSLIALTNYADLDQRTQMTLDRMSREIRQVNKLTEYSPTNLTFQDWDGVTLQYVYNPLTKALTRTKGGVTVTNLTDCDFLEFNIFQRTPSNDTFQPYAITNVAETKLIELTWSCSRKILGTTANSESMQSAKIVIRKR